MALSEKQQNRLLTLLASFDGGAVQPSELKKVLDALIRVIKDLEQRVNGSIDRRSSELSGSVDKTLQELRAKEKELRTLIADVDAAQARSVESIRTQLLDAVKRVEGMIPELPEEADLSDIYTSLQTVQQGLASVSELQTAENIRNMLELLEGEERLNVSAIDGLEERLVKLGKSVTQLKGSANVPSPMHVPTFEKFTMNGSDTTVTLMHAVGAAGHAIFNVTYQGQVLHRDEHYTVDGNKITLVGFTPAANKIISVSYMP